MRTKLKRRKLYSKQKHNQQTTAAAREEMNGTSQR
jgi:hypothetical protein